MPVLLSSSDSSEDVPGAADSSSLFSMGDEVDLFSLFLSSIITANKLFYTQEGKMATKSTNHPSFTMTLTLQFDHSYEHVHGDELVGL